MSAYREIKVSITLKEKTVEEIRKRTESSVLYEGLTVDRIIGSLVEIIANEEKIKETADIIFKSMEQKG